MTDMKHSRHFDNDPRGPVSDERLDELLRLAEPRIDRRRSRRLRKFVGSRLRDGYGFGWFKQRPVVATAIIACLLAFASLGWLPKTGPTISQNDAPEIQQSGVEVIGADVTQADQPRDIPRRGNNETAKLMKRPSQAARRSPRRRETDRFHDAAAINRIVTENVVTLASHEVCLAMIEAGAVVLERAEYEAALNPANHRVRSGLVDQEHVRQLASLVSTRHQIEAVLTKNLRHPRRDVAISSFRVLCRVGSRRSLPVILRHWDQREVQPDVVAAAVRLADVKTLGQLVVATQDTELQTQLMTELLCRDERGSGDLFLELTAQHGLYAVARASGGRADCERVEWLLTRLRSNRAAIARAAAITLSNVDDPAVPVQLFAMAQQAESRQVAVMALTARRDSSSQRFVKRASKDIHWLATVGNAQRKWQRMLAVN